MSSAYIATSEYARILCAYDKNPAKALKRVSRLIEKMVSADDCMMLTSVNVGYDDDGYYNISAVVSTTSIEA